MEGCIRTSGKACGVVVCLYTDRFGRIVLSPCKAEEDERENSEETEAGGQTTGTDSADVYPQD